MKEIRAHIFVSGQVQAVFFRADTCRVAESLGLTGFVKNLPDGRVEIVVEGKEQKIKDLIVWAKQGPPAAKVNDINIEWQQCRQEFKDFRIL